MEDLGKSLILLGLVIAGVGGALVLGPKVPWLGRLPGDLAVDTSRVKFYFPLATSLLISLVLSALLYFWRR